MSIAQEQPQAGAPPARAGISTELCRITVLSAHSQVDLAVPSGVPLAVLVPGIVDTIDLHRPTNDFDDSSEHDETTGWVLAKIGQSPLSDILTLHEHGIRDGDLLMLQSTQAGAPPPLFDDVMHDIALADTGSDPRWTHDRARVLGSVAAVIGTVIASFGLLWSGAGTDGFLRAGSALVTALLFVIAGTITSRVYGDTSASVVASGCAVPLAFTSGILFVPGEPAAPHLLLGLVLSGTIAVLALRVGGVGSRLFTALSTISLFGSFGSLLAVSTDFSAHAIAAGVLVLALVGLAFSARVSIVLAGIALPAVPAPGTSVDPTEDQPDSQGHSVTTSHFDSVSRRAIQARRYLTGLVVAMTVLAVFGALVSALPSSEGGIYWPGTALAIATAVVLRFRGRTYSSAEQAGPLLCGGVVIIGLLLTTAVFTVPDDALVLFALSIVFALAALVFGIIAPGRSYSPVLRRMTELIDLAVTASIIPLACWVAELYTMLRAL